ncbi:50S ribosomal protein L1-like isoform X1 [Zingiber officinale]|uniref:50S ribosomal protein L1-like isoform X1 n=1 Tax=Zingiber officinale TaxID=94328 RepID=UPI001C4B0F64|nr:50S ribosomal protein L1-like isoform X1 [Zingiber officinale]
MARLAHLLLSHAGHCHRLRPSQSVSFFWRSLSSSGPISPVSYTVKPKDPNDEGDPDPSAKEAASPPSHPTPPPSRPRSSFPDGGSGPWTREDARFVKDVPTISPVSYASRVAPLPEYKAPDPQENRDEEGLLQQEARRIQPRGPTRSIFATQEEEKIPFPTLIPQEKKPQKVPMDLMEAIRQVKVNARRQFVETVEAHVNLGVDPRRGDQMVRGALTLPHGTGKTVRVAVFAEGPSVEEARAAGADIVGGNELIEEIKNGGGKLNFDKCIATPMFMPRLSKIARILGPRGLMPNPKLGSVTSDVSGAVKAAKSGRIDFKIDKTAIVHVGLGKVNFSEESLRENIGAFVHSLLVAKPVGLKKTSKYAGYVKNFTLSSTMGPGFPITIQSLSLAADNYNKVHVKQ